MKFKLSFSRKKLFLDTNIIVSLMCIAEAHETVTNVVSLTKDLGVTMVYTPETRKEFLDYLDYSKRLYGRIPIHKKSIIEKTEPLMENPLIRSYWIESREKRLTWNAFVVRMEGFQEFLKDKFSIVVDTTKIEGVWSDPEYSELERAVFVADINKPQPTVAHDAYHLLMIKKIREKETIDELGLNSYFLTRDYTLDMAEHIVHRGGLIPSHLPIDVWSQMILPFLSPVVVVDKGSDVYMKIMTSKFPSLTKSIPPKDLIDVMGIWMDDPTVTTELLRKTIGSKYLHEHLEKIRKEPEVKPSEISKVVSPILKQVISATREKYETQISNFKVQHDQEISALKKDIGSLKTLLSQRRKIHKPLFLVGILLFLALIISPFTASSLQYSLPDSYYYCLMTSGILFIASSVFGPIIFKKLWKP